MKSSIAAFLLSAAVLGAMPVVSLAQSPATQPVDAAADVPVKDVVLYSSGVGYFEHFGTVHGDGSTTLRFKTDQINDLLKSLILQDMDGGRVNAIEYPSQDPIQKTLASFQVNINGNPPLADLLNQLRGARVSVTASGDSFDGTILGTEAHQQIAVPNTPPVTSWRLNLISGATIRQIDLEKLTDVKLQDPKLQDELTRALAAVAQSRDQDKKPVSIHFTGQGDRRVRLGYVVATPIWKASYRLLLGDPKDPKSPSQMQGWAIVENQTDNDWKNVQLTLVSGRPLSFIEDLYQPLYLQRPTVTPPLFAGLVPQRYEGGRVMDKAGEVTNAALPAPEAMGDRSIARFGAQKAMRSDALSINSVTAAAPPMDPTASVQALASASQIGELFQYTVGDVSIARQTSSMIPIITDPIEIERVSIYNQNVLPKNPLNGARLKNTTGKHLLTGPITVLDHGSYAGDAQIDNLPPGQERLISYGVDLQMAVDATQHNGVQSLLTGKISKGVLILSNKNVDTQTYVITNKTDADRKVIVEQPRIGGWELVKGDNTPIETTDELYRFKVTSAASKSQSITVQQQNVSDETIALLDGDMNRVLYLSQQGEIPKTVRDALAAVIAKKGAMADLDRRMAEVTERLNKYPAEQARIRENIKIFDPNSEARHRLQAKLDAQETEIEKQQADFAELQKQRDAAQADYAKSIADLNVG